MQTFKKHKVVDQADLDHLAHVNNVNYVQWVQDIAQQHWESKVDEKISSNYYWVLIEHNIQYKSAATLGDVLKMVTYVIKSEGVKSRRAVEIYNKNTDELLVKSETTWCFMSKETNKPARIPESVIEMFC